MSYRSVRLSVFLATLLTAATGDGPDAGADCHLRRRPRLRRVTRGPATTTFLGDTGLWYVPTAEILPARKWSVSGYRVNFDDNQGFIGHLELARDVRLRPARSRGAVRIVRGRQPHRPRRPPAVPRDCERGTVGANRQAGGFVPQNPLARAPWSGNQVGDSLGRRARSTCVRVAPAAGGVRDPRHGKGCPPATEDSGASTGKADFALDAIVSKEINSARRTLRLRRLHRPRHARRGRTDQRLPLGRGRGISRRASRCDSPRRSTARLYTKNTLATKTHAARRRRIVPAGRLRLRR